jgi:hypothetical protein
MAAFLPKVLSANRIGGYNRNTRFQLGFYFGRRSLLSYREYSFKVVFLLRLGRLAALIHFGVVINVAIVTPAGNCDLIDGFLVIVNAVVKPFTVEYRSMVIRSG